MQQCSGFDIVYNMKNEITEKPLITVKVISTRLLEQLYPSRGDLDMKADNLADNEEAVGALLGGGGVVIRNKETGRLRMMWPYRYCVGLGLGGSQADIQTTHRAAIAKLPQLFQS